MDILRTFNNLKGINYQNIKAVDIDRNISMNQTVTIHKSIYLINAGFKHYYILHIADEKVGTNNYQVNV